MDIEHIHRPFLTTIAIPATIVYAAIAVMLLRRSVDARLLVGAPIIGNFAVATYIASESLAMLLLVSSGGVITRSAAVSEALRYVTAGATVAVVLSGVAALVRGQQGRSTGVGSVLLGLSAPALVASAALLWYMTQLQITRLEFLQELASSLFVLNSVLCIAAIAAAFVPTAWRLRTLTRRWFLMSGALAAAMSVSAYTIAARLHAFIESS